METTPTKDFVKWLEDEGNPRILALVEKEKEFLNMLESKLPKDDKRILESKAYLKHYEQRYSEYVEFVNIWKDKLDI